MTAQELVDAVLASTQPAYLDGIARSQAETADLLFGPRWRVRDIRVAMESSGTGGGRKRRLWTQRHVLSFLNIQDAITGRRGGHWIIARRPGYLHLHFLYCCLAGGTPHLHPYLGVPFLPSMGPGILADVRAFAPTVILGQPNLLDWLLRMGGLGPNIQLFCSTGRAIDLRLVQELDTLHPTCDLSDRYGPSEMGHVAHSSKADKLALGHNVFHLIGEVAPEFGPDGRIRLRHGGYTTDTMDGGSLDAQGRLVLDSRKFFNTWLSEVARGPRHISQVGDANPRPGEQEAPE